MSAMLNRREVEMVARVLKKRISDWLDRNRNCTVVDLAKQCGGVVTIPLLTDLRGGRVPYMDERHLRALIRGLEIRGHGILSVYGKGVGPTGGEFDTLSWDACVEIILQQDKPKGTLWD